MVGEAIDDARAALSVIADGHAVDEKCLALPWSVVERRVWEVTGGQAIKAMRAAGYEYKPAKGRRS